MIKLVHEAAGRSDADIYETDEDVINLPVLTTAAHYALETDPLPILPVKEDACHIVRPVEAVSGHYCPDHFVWVRWLASGWHESLPPGDHGPYFLSPEEIAEIWPNGELTAEGKRRVREVTKRIKAGSLRLGHAQRVAREARGYPWWYQ